jgi:hypothetical protein
MRSFLLIAILGAGGCALSHSVQQVDFRLWQLVPEAQQSAIEQKTGREIAVALQEQRAAQAALADARRVLSQPRTDPRVSDGSQRKALVRVRATERAAMQTRVEWREELLEAADLHAATARASLELEKAQAVALRVDDFDPAPFRGQHARLHHDWSSARTRAAAGRAKAEGLDRDVFSAKAAYARTCTSVSTGPIASVETRPN